MGTEARARRGSVPQHGLLLKASLVLGDNFRDRPPSSFVSSMEQGEDLRPLALESTGLSPPLARRGYHGESSGEARGNDLIEKVMPLGVAYRTARRPVPPEVEDIPHQS